MSDADDGPRRVPSLQEAQTRSGLASMTMLHGANPGDVLFVDEETGKLVPRMIFVVAKNYREGEFYCRMVAHPELNPKDPKQVVIFSADAPGNTHGRYFTEADTIVYYGDYFEGRYAADLEAALAACFRLQGRPKKERVYG